MGANGARRLCQRSTLTESVQKGSDLTWMSDWSAQGTRHNQTCFQYEYNKQRLWTERSRWEKGGEINSDTTILLEIGALLDMAYDRVISIR